MAGKVRRCQAVSGNGRHTKPIAGGTTGGTTGGATGGAGWQQWRRSRGVAAHRLRTTPSLNEVMRATYTIITTPFT